MNHRLSRGPVARLLLASILVVAGVCACDRPAPVANDAATAIEPTVPDGNEFYVRAAIVDETRAALLAGDYATLEQRSSEYRDTKARTPSGIWKLSSLYAGLEEADAALEAKDDEGWAALDAHFEAWMQAFPDSPTARLGRAQMLIDRGWRYRGGCFVDCVDAEAWQPFRDHVEQARRMLEADKAVAGVDPKWYQLMAAVAMVQDWPPETFAPFEAEALAHADYYDAAFALADSYEPKWGGSAMELDAFAHRLVERTRATEGTGMYARLYWSAMTDNAGFDDSAFDWPTMVKGMDDVLAKYPDAWNRSHFVAFACARRDHETAARLLRGIERLQVSAFKDPGDMEACRQWAAGAAP